MLLVDYLTVLTPRGRAWKIVTPDEIGALCDLQDRLVEAYAKASAVTGAVDSSSVGDRRNPVRRAAGRRLVPFTSKAAHTQSCTLRT